VLLVLALLAVQLTVEPVGPVTESPGITDATTLPTLQAAGDRALAGIAEAEAELEGQPDSGAAALREGLAEARRVVQREVERRGDWIRATEEARLAGREPPPPLSTLPQIYFDGDQQAWDPESNPLTVAWLPGFANDWLNQLLRRAVENLETAREDPTRLVNSFLGLLPAALFVLLPLLALLLKGFYVFTGRLYMEHMVVALHSHAFFGLALIIATALDVLNEAVPHGYGLATATSFLLGLSLAWIPLYLAIMQRRVYAQGWPLTLAKFLAIGVIYLLLLVAALTAAALVTLIQG
jgi:hypothetical protein